MHISGLVYTPTEAFFLLLWLRCRNIILFPLSEKIKIRICKLKRKGAKPDSYWDYEPCELCYKTGDHSTMIYNHDIKEMEGEVLCLDCAGFVTGTVL